jgi:aspartate ammonia-lyase
MRKENDFIGEVELPNEALYGINAFRAVHNFPDSTRFSIEWYRALGSVKKACYLTYRKYATEAGKKFTDFPLPVPLINKEIIEFLIQASAEIEEGGHFDHFIVPAIQGGAGTSANLNVNEIIANRALLISGHKIGDYGFIHPIEHANIFQSTNDVVPTALKIALIRLFQQLAATINTMRLSLEIVEKETRDHVRIAYTEMQEAVPTTYGRLFSTYCDAFSRDWWRVSKCSERIKAVNLGGSAIGSGITIPAYFIREVTRTLHEITGLPVTRAENLNDATCNLDSFVEVHAILKAHAVNLEKTASDLRLLSSDLIKNRELSIPRLQTGSSIMPGKVNPVISEFVISAAHKVYSNDMLISNLCAQGCLELNAYIPIIGHCLIESIRLLINCDTTINQNLFAGIRLNKETAMEFLLNSPSVSTALIPYIGYVKASEAASVMKNEQVNLLEACKRLNLLDEDKLKSILSPDRVLSEGFLLNDIV